MKQVTAHGEKGLWMLLALCDDEVIEYREQQIGVGVCLENGANNWRVGMMLEEDDRWKAPVDGRPHLAGLSYVHRKEGESDEDYANRVRETAAKALAETNEIILAEKAKYDAETRVERERLKVKASVMSAIFREPLIK